jgi:hypothetical protein
MMRVPLVGGQQLEIKLVREHAGPPPADRETGKRSRGQADPMRAHGKVIAALLLLVAIGLAVGSFLTGTHEHLPSVALKWVFGLQLLRAGLAFAIIATLVALLVRGSAGIWPVRAGSSGLEWKIEEVARRASEVAKLAAAESEEDDPPSNRG